MSYPPLTSAQAYRAADAGLGRYVGPLLAHHASAMRTATVGVALLAVAGGFWRLHPLDGFPEDAIVIVLTLVGLVVAAMGLIELVPTPSRVYLFEDGYLQVVGARESVVLYASENDGEWLQIRARTVLATRPA